MSVRQSAPDFQTFQREFTQHIRNPLHHLRPAGVDARRMRVYQQLVYANIEGFLLRCFPVLRQTVGTRKWRELMRGFLAEHLCTSPLFREIPQAFVAYLQTRPWDGAAPALFLCELAHYEWIELALGSAVAPAMPDLDAMGDLAHGRPYLTPVHALLSYTYPVHRLGGRRKPKRTPLLPTHLLVFRTTSFDVRFIVLNAVSARLISLIQGARLSGNRALQKIARELQHRNAQLLVEQGLQVLRELRAAGALLGTLKR